MCNVLYLNAKKITKVLLLGTIVVVATLFARHAEGTVSFYIEQEGAAYIGTEVVLLLGGNAATARDASFEWSFDGNARPILFRRGGLESQITPIDTEPITAFVSAFDANGDLLASASLTLEASEFSVEIVMVEPEPFMLWDANAQQDVAADGLIAGVPFQLEVRLTPDYSRVFHCTWTTDAATAIRAGRNEQRVTVVRNDIGDAEVSVVVRNADGLVLGRGARDVNVPITRSRIYESNRRRTAWNQWQEAQSQWAARNFDEAMASATAASETDPETREIMDGFEAMRANHNRVLRSRQFIAEAVSLHGEQNLAEALRIYRRAYAAWPLSETQASIRALESEIDKMRIRAQQVEWLRDTAAAYDQEGLFAEALRYYRATLELQPDDEAVAQRAERIEYRLASIAQATALLEEGRALEAAGRLVEAVEKYNASLSFESNAALEAHARDLEATIGERMTQAAALRTEATNLLGGDNDAEALLRFRESYLLWPDEELGLLIAELEQTVTEPAEQVIRAAVDFGIGTQADAARLLQEGHALYRDGRYREALEIYRKSFAISSDARLGDWIRMVETSLEEYDAVLRANALIKEANNLYSEGDHAAAIEKYRESLAIHFNAEVENFIRMLEELNPDLVDGNIVGG